MYKYLILPKEMQMLLDELFDKSPEKEKIIARKNGKISCMLRPVIKEEPPKLTKPLFPISKDRSK